MLAILACHYTGSSGIPGLHWKTLSTETVFIQSFGMFGRTACSVFVFLTGWFFEETTRKSWSGHVRRIVPLVAETSFYCSSIYMILCLFGIKPLSVRGLLVGLVFPLAGGNVWFVSTYVVFWMAIPLIAAFLDRLNKMTFQRFLLSAFAIWSVLTSLNPFGFDWSFGSFDYFALFFATGFFFRRFDPLGALSMHRLVVCSMCSIALLPVSVLCFDFVGTWLENDSLIRHAMHFCTENSFLSVLCAISVSSLFLRLDFSSRLLNWISKSVLAVYVIHANLMDQFWVWWWPAKTGSICRYLHAPAKIIAVFAICVCIDKIRAATLGHLGRTVFDILWPEEEFRKTGKMQK